MNLSRSPSFPGHPRPRFALAAFALLLSTSPAPAHLHLQIALQSGSWDLHLLDFDSGRSEPESSLLRVARAARVPIPDSAAFQSALGPAGNPVWILPQIENPLLLFLGIGTQGIRAGTLLGNRLRLHLDHLDGPGEFVLFTSNPLGTPTVHLTSRDGVDPAADFIEVPAVNAHVHVNWAFTRAGTYRLGFRASARRADDGLLTESPTVTYTFSVEGPPPPKLLILPPPDPDNVRLLLQSDPAEPCHLLASDNLVTWTLATNVTNPTGLRELLLPTPIDPPGRPRFWKAFIP